jgi:hypothetical protein
MRACVLLRAKGCERFDTYTPVPVPRLYPGSTFIPRWALGGALLGGVAGFALQYWVSAVEVASNVGGRPLNSWQAFVPVTFECAILCASVATVAGIFAGSRLPRFNHPVFSAAGFSLADRDHYYVAVSASDPSFDHEQMIEWLTTAGAEEVTDLAE